MKGGRALAWAIAALLYLLLPVDVLPDFWPLVGWVDDLLAVGLAAYYIWRQVRPRGVPPSGGPSMPGGGEPPPAAPAEDPWTVLGVSRGSDREAIQKAYRAQMAQYHPDKVAHLGPELRRVAEERTLAIRKAFDELMGEA